MSIVSVGYDGSIFEPDLAKWASFSGRQPCVANAAAWKVTTVPGPDRTVRVATGIGWGDGVHDTSNTTVDIQLATIASGTRWDTICARRLWTPTPGGTTTFVGVSGTATQGIAAGLNANPGVSADQPLYLAQVTAGQSTPTALVDLRAIPKAAVVYPSLLALPPGSATGTIADVAGVLYVKGASTWAKDTTGDTGWLTSSVLVTATGWGNVNTAVRVRNDECEIKLGYKRSGAAVPVSAQTGSVADSLVCTMNLGYRPPAGPAIPAQAMYGGTSAGGAYINSAGEIRFYHGSVDIPLASQDNLSAQFRFFL